ncbi:MAG TPA: hypothetical protein VIM48_11425, partial [Chthoniobacterales bacterium]
MKSLAKFLLPLFFCGALLGSSQAGTDSARTVRLLHELKNLPYGHTPFGTVYKLVMELTRRHPEAAYNYFLAGYLRLSPRATQLLSTALYLAKNIEDVV